ncbi:MAG: hypothetical protein HPY69_02960 [Armatimonadetes bacterium]|nr:hypothetical protein [Armatimonadota bacterium]
MQVNELGFVSDHKIKLWPSGTTVDPNNDAPIWKRTNNPNHPVCYTKNTAPSTFGKFGVTPSVSPDQTGIRV